MSEFKDNTTELRIGESWNSCYKGGGLKEVWIRRGQDVVTIKPKEIEELIKKLTEIKNKGEKTNAF